MNNRELMQKVLSFLETDYLVMCSQFYMQRDMLADALRKQLAQPDQLGSLTDDEWKQMWEEFNDGVEDQEEEFQERMIAKHGEGYYYIDAEESWAAQQKLIQRLVEAKLREKNT